MKKVHKKNKRGVVRTYKWKKLYVDGKVSEKILGASHPGCCKQ